MATGSYPLEWPQGWERTSGYRRSNKRFITTYAKTIARLEREMKLLGAKNVVISSNIPLRQDGMPRADVARYRIEDPGVATYFTLRNRQMAMARDAYDSVYDNLHSLMLAVSYLRGMERHGGGAMLERAFEGFATIAAPGATKSWREKLRIPPDERLTLETLDVYFRAAAKRAHPDAGGSHALFIEVSEAALQGRRELGVRNT